MQISARNQLKGKVKSVILGAVTAEVVVDVAGHEVVSMITKSSAVSMKLAVVTASSRSLSRPR